mmetsp:Transcript_28799/g.85205  ORF Transcript_28799/g.85205 Transcript_28799/m.85205 type:complete len:361 (+) Transcript_28799:780-1862(+)
MSASATGGLSVNLVPSVDATYRRMAPMSLSSHSTFTSSSAPKPPGRSSGGPSPSSSSATAPLAACAVRRLLTSGRRSMLSGSDASVNLCHASGLASTARERPCRPSTECSKLSRPNHAPLCSQPHADSEGGSGRVPSLGARNGRKSRSQPARGTAPDARPMDVAMRKLKRRRWRSKRPRQTVLYMNSVVYVSSELRRTRRLSLGGALSKQRLNSDVKYERLYWYMGSTIARSATTKYNRLPRVGRERYTLRASLICRSVCSASATRADIVWLVALEVLRVLINTSSSKMLPVDSRSSLSTLSSRSSSWRLSFPIDTTKRSLVSSRSGRSFRTTLPSSWSSRPFVVTVKLMRLTLMQTSGR